MLNTRKASNYTVLFDLKQNKTSLSQENLFIHKKNLDCSLFVTHLSVIAKRINWCTPTQSWTFEKSLRVSRGWKVSSSVKKSFYFPAEATNPSTSILTYTAWLEAISCIKVRFQSSSSLLCPDIWKYQGSQIPAGERTKRSQFLT